MEQVTELNKWLYECSDEVSEVLENHRMAIVLIAGASSSGKGFASKKLFKHLEEQGHSPLLLSTDDYYKGISKMMVDKVNKNLYGGNLHNIDEIVRRVRDITILVPFIQKFDDERIEKLHKSLNVILSKRDTSIVCNGLSEEFSHINFDEPEAVNLEQFIKDINTLVSSPETPVYKRLYSMKTGEFEVGECFDSFNKNVIIAEGLYALHPQILTALKNTGLITSFIESDPKTLFVRRMIRDAKRTSCSNATTVNLLLKSVMPSYSQHILPTKESAKIILKNCMTFDELQTGIIESQYKIKLIDSYQVRAMLQDKKIGDPQKITDFYLVNSDDKNIDPENILRLRVITQQDGKIYPDSLTHKGMKMKRSDGKNIRSLNKFIEPGEFENTYSNYLELLSDFIKNGFVVKKVIQNLRQNYKLGEYDCNLDHVEGLGDFFEIKTVNYKCELSPEEQKISAVKKMDLFQKLTGIQGTPCESYFEQAVEKNICNPTSKYAKQTNLK